MAIHKTVPLQEAMSGWISVDKRLPKKDEWPVVCETRYPAFRPGERFFEIANGDLIGSSGLTMPAGTVRWKPIAPAPMEAQ